MSSPYIYFHALYPFQGDATAQQLSLEPGTLIRVKARHAAAASSTHGWTWGTIHGYHQPSGWFPTGYVVLTSPHTSNQPSLPWIQQSQRQEQRNDTNADNGFEGSLLGGESPALDYSRSNKVLNDDSNPFTKEDSGPLFEHVRLEDRISTEKPTSQNITRKFKKGWQNVGKASIKLLNRRRRVAAVDSYKPAVHVTPSSSVSNSTAH